MGTNLAPISQAGQGNAMLPPPASRTPGALSPTKGQLRTGGLILPRPRAAGRSRPSTLPSWVHTKDCRPHAAESCRAVWATQKAPSRRSRWTSSLPQASLTPPLALPAPRPQPTGVPGAQKPCEQQPAGVASLSTWPPLGVHQCLVTWGGENGHGHPIIHHLEREGQ